MENTSQENSVYEPSVVAFCCHYCAYSAADLCGSMRLEYSPNIRIVRVLCTGKVDTLHLLKAFEDGADAVYVAGCEEGSCHFLEGNLRAKKKVAQAKNILKEVGIEPERLEFYNISASNSVLFANAADEMTERARKLGPNPLKGKNKGVTS
jgi:F420-non-reducing hydrogenase iron-sulfur subunit